MAGNFRSNLLHTTLVAGFFAGTAVLAQSPNQITPNNPGGSNFGKNNPGVGNPGTSFGTPSPGGGPPGFSGAQDMLDSKQGKPKLKQDVNSKNIPPQAPPTAGIGPTPVEKKIEQTKDKQPGPDSVKGPGPGQGQTGGSAGAPDMQRPLNPNDRVEAGRKAVCGALPAVQNPGSRAATRGDRIPASEIGDLEIRAAAEGERGQPLHLRDNSFRASADVSSFWVGLDDNGRPATVEFYGGEVQVGIVGENGEYWTITYANRIDSMPWRSTEYHHPNGKVERFTPESERVRKDAAKKEKAGEGKNTGLPPSKSPPDKGGTGPGSQPGVDETRNVWCETKVADPNAGTSREKGGPQGRGSDDRNIPNASGVIVQSDPPPTPSELKEKVTQPGEGSAGGGTSQGMGRNAGDFAQPSKGGAGGPAVSGGVPGGPKEAAGGLVPNPSGPAQQK